MKKIVGIIGPYFSGGGNRRLIDQNIANAQYVMIRIANRFAENRLIGFFAPHSHTARFEVLARAPEAYYHELDDAIYTRACDAFVLLPGWEKSGGSIRDKGRAEARGCPIIVLESYSDEDINKLLFSLELLARDKLGR